MASAVFEPPTPINEPVLSYAPGTPERDQIKSALDELADERIEIPLIIDGEEVRTGRTAEAVMPHDHGHTLATWHMAGPDEVAAAIDSSQRAWREWSEWPWEDRISVFLRAADLLAGPWRDRVNGATMLGQSKTVHQAEIDAACELIDFWRFNAQFAWQIYRDQPICGPGVWNRMDYRPLEGFVYAVSPFNFTSIGGNLPTAPAMMGNVVLWKPSNKAVYSNYFIMKLLQAAGLPDGVMNFVPGDSTEVTGVAVDSPHFAGLHYTGSTRVLRMLWGQISENLESYRSYPRIVGETGGKDFVVAHASAEVDSLAVALVRGAFEYQGQKCSAVSRAYVPESIWPQTRDRLLTMTDEIRMGDPRDFRNFMAAVIDGKAYEKITGYIDWARDSDAVEILAGGEYDDSKGWFVQPTIVRTRDPQVRLMHEEVFGPVLTLYVYPDARWEETLGFVDRTSPYGLTGAVFARDRKAVRQADRTLRHAAGNYYVNDKPTGAVVGQQPFGGARASGTNDKAGSYLNLVRWISPRSIKETHAPATDFRYPFMDAK